MKNQMGADIAAMEVYYVAVGVAERKIDLSHAQLGHGREIIRISIRLPMQDSAVVNGNWNSGDDVPVGPEHTKARAKVAGLRERRAPQVHLVHSAEGVEVSCHVRCVVIRRVWVWLQVQGAVRKPLHVQRSDPPVWQVAG